MTSSDPVSVVLAWHSALNAADVDRLLALCHRDITVGGPRGSTSGPEAVREWFARAQLRLEPMRVFQRGSTVVIEQQAQWPGSAPRPVASVFEVEGTQVTSVIRHPDVSAALQSSGLTEADAVPRQSSG